MGDPWLQSMLVHTVDAYHIIQEDAGGGDLVERYPALPDIDDLACAIVMDGQTLAESPVGYLIESDAILYCEDAALRELDKIIWDGRTFFVNGTPSRYYYYHGATPDTPHILQIGLKEEKRVPA